MAENDITNGDETTRVDDATRQAEQRDAQKPADAGHMPTAEEEAAAEKNSVDPEVAKNEKAFVKKGANLKGEGQIEG